MEATAGFEPADKGFADLSLSHLGTSPYILLIRPDKVGIADLSLSPALAGVRRQLNLGFWNADCGFNPNSEI